MSKTKWSATEDTRVREIQERRRSGASGTHRDRRARRMRDRTSARRHAIADSA